MCECERVYCAIPDTTCDGGVGKKWWINCWHGCCSVSNDPPGGGGGDCDTCYVGKYTCRDNCLECPTEEYAGNCVGGQKYCKTISCACCDQQTVIDGVFDDGICRTKDNRIKVWGWACDEDDYEQALDIHVFIGNNFHFSGVADIPAEEAVGDKCGGHRNHRFDIVSPDPYPKGNYSVGVKAINIGEGEDVFLKNSQWLYHVQPTYLKVALTHILSKRKDKNIWLGM